MRLAEDHDSWKASGIIRRDFRSVRNGPEVDRHKGGRKKKPKKPKKINHRHVYVDVTGTPEAPWWSRVELSSWYYTRSPAAYRRRIRNRRVLRCAEPGCPKYKVQQF